MSTFNDSNVDGRFRLPVRGRVIVFTTSKVVEFLQDNLLRSFPLYSVADLPDGYGLSFCVELNGFLTFDKGSYVKMTDSLKPFESVYYHPTAFAVVRSADPAPVTVPVVAPPTAVVTSYEFLETTRTSNGPNGGPGTVRKYNVSWSNQFNPQETATSLYMFISDELAVDPSFFTILESSLTGATLSTILGGGFWFTNHF